MCLVALALQRSSRFPLIIAANRDEFYARPAAALDWWRPAPTALPLLGGRDLQAGGTWLGLTRAGRLALLTNVRHPARRHDAAPSRGAIVALWLRGDTGREAFIERIADAGYDGFNLIAADFARDEVFFVSNRGEAELLGPGLYGLSNAALDTPWPKVLALKARVEQALREAKAVEALRDRLFDALADRSLAPDDRLPDTGVPREWERLLSAAFIDAPEHGYGTRCSSLVIAERTSRGATTHVFERGFDGAPAADRHFALEDWPQSMRAMSTCARPTSSYSGPLASNPARR